MIRKLLIRIKVFFIFLGWTFNSPLDIVENWEDMGTRYFFETDEEMIQLQKDITEMFKKRHE